MYRLASACCAPAAPNSPPAVNPAASRGKPLGIDFTAHTATNSTPGVEPTNLFNPDLAGLLDFADIFALSNLPSLNGLGDFSHLLVLRKA